MIKRHTGGDTRKGAKLYGHSYDYTPSDKMFFLANHRPAIKDNTVGMWARVVVIPFNRQFTKEGERDLKLDAKLWKEREGIFAWMVEGAHKYLKAGRLPRLPEACQLAKDEYRESNDVLGRFVSDRMIEQRDALVSLTDLYSSYKDWCFENQETPINRDFFAEGLNERGMRKAKRNIGIVFFDWKLAAKENAILKIEPSEVEVEDVIEIETSDYPIDEEEDDNREESRTSAFVKCIPGSLPDYQVLTPKGIKLELEIMRMKDIREGRNSLSKTL